MIVDRTQQMKPKLFEERFMKLRWHPAYLFLILLLSLLAVVPAFAADPVVHVVLFYSPTCPHCEKVINEDLPPLQKQYGDQFQLMAIDVSYEGGQRLYQNALNQFNVPDDRVGVPTLIVGNTVLVGSVEIPEQLPGILEQGLAAGGIAWPGIPGLEQIIPDAAQGNPPDPGSITPSGAPSASPLSPEAMAAKFAKDPIANSLAVIVLVVMLLSVVGVIWRFLSSTPHPLDHWPSWIIPVVSVLGLGVALYLTYVETTQSQAICGPVGDCNSVQQSPYAMIFGVIPVGLFGAAGYIAILGAWFVQRRTTGRLHNLATIGIWSMAWFGIIYSIYLTFLEPFVIGATCMWCLSSAVFMTLVFWASTGPAKRSWESDDVDADDEEYEGEFETEEV
jgi:uncharacterized membrane protein/thiol-disulfide isomerase/thioredoxin